MQPRAGTRPKAITVSGKPCALDVAQCSIAVILRAEGSAVCLAQPNGLGDRIQTVRIGPTARPFAPINPTRTSIPHVSLVDLDVVLITDASILVLECHLRVVLDLIANVRID